ncbi:MaoC family dehydratase N-terminal domain-containing protein [Pullulanibacillus sp. KACC 23026]|uniref:MaoC family dehydratase N-terminal domain-containing protein n=1 Tax=Pullulanibacillus sp. KACC 23026 TaxID=3028315 RepID=UPI0023AEE4C8|nr:MaoC family dehydratase N-terminal domain-containing protein [Pullulanibacillus sp. KACC 23026]WEG10813.1 MaoC family dehydratase N-terminal domain-containing protein [Pullulanibacillus sp. KACC 23026]
MFNEIVGKRSNKVKNTVERGAVKKFAEAIGDPHPLFVDEEAGIRSKYGVNIAPPTFPRTFDYGVIEEMPLPEKGLIHGEQSFHYEQPLLVGETIYCYQEVINYYERKGNFGEMGFLVIKRVGESPLGELIFTDEQVIIISEAVKKGMGV